jgi:hypothetical protein
VRKRGLMWMKLTKARRIEPVEVVMYAASQRPNVTPSRMPSSPQVPFSALSAAAND